MGEALIGRYGSGGDADISNETKATLGLPNDATLDDCLQSLGLKDPNYATIIVTLLDVDGTPIPNNKINMTTNTTISYTTNAIGQCMFKTNYGTATFSDVTNSGYYDLSQSSSVAVDCVVGGIYKIELKRRIKGNGYSERITSNKILKFSKYLNTIDVSCYGGSGSGSTASYIINSTDNSYVDDGVYSKGSWTISVNQSASRGEGGHINSKTVIIEADRNYNCYIGSAGAGSAKSQTIEEYGSLVSGYSDLYRARFRNNNTDPFNGSSGGTTMFDNEISALGGSGGIVGEGDKQNYGGTIGGINTYASLNNTPYNIYFYSRSVLVKHKFNTQIGAGNAGYIWLNNFQYKI